MEWGKTCDVGFGWVVMLAFHIIGAKPSEVPMKGDKAVSFSHPWREGLWLPTEGQQSQWSNHIGVTNVARHHLQENPIPL